MIVLDSINSNDSNLNMGEFLPDGTYQQWYTGICDKCKKEIQVNQMGYEIGDHICLSDDERKEI